MLLSFAIFVWQVPAEEEHVTTPMLPLAPPPPPVAPPAPAPKHRRPPHPSQFVSPFGAFGRGATASTAADVCNLVPLGGRKHSHAHTAHAQPVAIGRDDAIERGRAFRTAAAGSATLTAFVDAAVQDAR